MDTIKKERKGKTMTVSSQTSIRLARLTVRMRSRGIECYKNTIVAVMTNHFDKNPDALAQLLKA